METKTLNINQQNSKKQLLQEYLSFNTWVSNVIKIKKKQIFSKLLNNSNNIEEPNFKFITNQDIHILFDLYDEIFFKHLLSKTIKELTGKEIKLSLSRRMTSTAGLFTYYKKNNKAQLSIKIAIDLIFNQFKFSNDPVNVNGLPCSNRLEIVQTVFEHELIHLIEFIVWESTTDKGIRFQNLAETIFLHQEYYHHLITWKKQAQIQSGIKVSSRVEFKYKNTRYEGIVVKITKRATVIVENPKGTLYSDGKRYVRYYIPIDQIKLFQKNNQ